MDRFTPSRILLHHHHLYLHQKQYLRALLKLQHREQPDKNKGFGFITFEDMAMAVAAKDGAR